MKIPLSAENAYNKAATICSKSEQCRYDIQKKLTAWGISTTEAEIVINRLISDRYIDEQRYANAFVNDKYKFQHWGRIKIKYELRMRNIPSSIIECAITHIDEDEYESILKSIICHKYKNIKTKDSYTVRRTLFNFALSRGFESNMITSILQTIIKDSTAEYYDY